MELKAIEEFITPVLLNEVPTEPGLYLYLQTKQENKNSPIVDLVEVRYEKSSLIADSDNWDSYLPVKAINKYYPGKWSKKIYFEK